MDLRGTTSVGCVGVKDENADLLADSDNILNRWKNYFQLLNVHIRQIEIHIQLNH
jgi:hypothetical protein